MAGFVEGCVGAGGSWRWLWRGGLAWGLSRGALKLGWSVVLLVAAVSACPVQA